MSINKKSMAVAAGLLLAVSATLTACGGATDKAADTANKAADTANKAGSDAMKAGGDAMKAGGDAAKAGGEKVTGAALEKTVSPVRAALVQANTAIGKGDMAGAKSQFGKFEMAWTVASPMVKTAAGDKFPMIEAGVDKLKTVMGGASPKKEEASSAITGMLGMLNGLKK